MKIRNFRDMPLKIHETRNVDSETWYKDLEIEVKNIGTKPIYFILAYLEFPDHKPGGRDTGLSVTFGELKYVDIAVIADPEDVHLDPGQTYVFTIPEENRKWLAKNNDKVPQEFKKFDFHIDIISFGDRNGFEIGRPLDLRNVKKHHGKRILTTKQSMRAVGEGPALARSRLCFHGRLPLQLTPAHDGAAECSGH